MDGSFYGLTQLGGLAFTSGDFAGAVQMGRLAAGAGHCTGIAQIGGVAAIAKYSRGAQVDAMTMAFEEHTGLQVGAAVTYAKSLRGVQIGLTNHAEDGVLPWTALLDMGFGDGDGGHDDVDGTERAATTVGGQPFVPPLSLTTVVSSFIAPKRAREDVRCPLQPEFRSRSSRSSTRLKVTYAPISIRSDAIPNEARSTSPATDTSSCARRA